MAKKWVVTIEEKTEYTFGIEANTPSEAIHMALTSKENRDEIFENAHMLEFSDKVIHISLLD